MSSDISYDPVSAIDENEAVGLTADIFLDIRQTMKIPLVTSIWRGLADIDDSLEAVWSMAKPCLLYTSPSPRDRTRSRMPSSA